MRRSGLFLFFLTLSACLASATAHAQATGLVASYSFEEGTGTTTVDASGNNNTGTLSNATWTTAGKYGKALSFNGTSSIVNVADAASLRLTSAMTLEAWVKPTAAGGVWRTVVMKEITGELAYALYSNEDVDVPAAYVRVGSTSRRVGGSGIVPLNSWTHLAATYTSGALRLYVNGTLVSTTTGTGSIASATRPLRIGGNTIWGEYFAGLIDEVKVYNRALSAAEIAADMAGATTAPRVTITAPAAGSTLTGKTVNVSYSTTGDTSQAAFVAVRLDGGATTFAPLAGSAQFTNVAFGAHTLNAWLARSDQAKIDNSDATPVSFTTAAPPPPVLSITAPANNASIGGTTAMVTYGVTGDLTEAHHVVFSLDGGAPLSITTLSGTLELDDLASGAHSISGYVARADNSQITGSDSATINFSMTASAPPPVLSFTVPANNAVLNSSTVTVSFLSSGDLGQADHAHLLLDGVEVAMTSGLSGTTQLTGVSSGAHTLGGYLARADHTKVLGSDATPRNFSVSIVSPNDPSMVGQWDPTIVPLPTVAVNLNLMHTSQLLFWAGDFESAANYGELWNPQNNVITDVPNPFSNIFCSAAVHLADGRLLVAGGHDKANGLMGLADSNLFDPVTQTWQHLPNMAYRRWYPTLTMLGDGKALILAGSENSETVNVEIPELFDPVAKTWTKLSNAAMSIPQYPMVYLLADGRLLQSGTTEHPTVTRTLNLATQTWTTIDSRQLEGGSGVMYAPGKIMKAGSSSNNGDTPNADSTATTYVLNMNDASPAWRQTTSMAYPRTFHNLTSLADGSVLVTSGSRKKSETNLDVGVVQAELWSPDTETWTTMASAQKPRIYHSTAVLLPDARVAVSGSGNIAGGTDQTNLEIYSPPYLFKGARPTITAAPALLKYGNSFFVQTPDGANIRAVNLIRLGAATHSFDQDQRFVPVTFSVVSGGLQVDAPSNANLLPPGYYMLFLISNAGVPSVAKYVRFPAPYEDNQAPTAPGTLQGSGGVGSGSLSWTAATDNVGVVRYEIYRSTTSGFTPSAANLVGQTTGTSYNDASVAAGTYYYKVLAVDAVGNKSAASNQVSVTVLADTIAPTVSIVGLADGSTVSGVFALQANAADNVMVAGVTFRVDGVAVGAEDTSSPYSVSWTTSNAANGAHVITALARDGAGNTTVSTAVNVTVNNSGPGTPAGLVGSWSFEEGSGTTTADSSGQTNTGTLNAGVTWSSTGKAGKALAFNGTNGMVTVADKASLDLTTAMTLSAWVNPSANANWRTVLLKEAGTNLVYGLYSSDTGSLPNVYFRTGSTDRSLVGTGALPTNTWTHLASTYDGSNLRLYVNGTLVRTVAATGNMSASTGALRIGGNSIWGEYFAGLIDEAHIYSRALSAAEIATDMNLAAPPSGPKLSITSPANNATIAGSTISVAFSTSGDTSQANLVALKIDSGAIVYAPLTSPVQLTGIAPGAHSLNGFLARSDQSKITGSDASAVSFTTTSNTPKLTITAPANGANISGTTISVSYSTSGDTSEADHVFISLDGGPNLRVQSLSGGLDIDSVPAGAHSLTGYVARVDDSKITGSDAATVSFSSSLPDTTKPVVVLTAPRDGATVSGSVTLSANAVDDVTVAGVRFKLDGVAIGSEDTSSPYAATWDSTAVANGVHVLTAVARDGSNNTAESLSVNVVVLNTVAQVPAGLVAAYSFDAGTGATATDSSGKSNTGTLANTTWTTSGKFGGALTFNGTSSMVTVADNTTLDLTNGMTLSAWVYPTSNSAAWRTVILKENTTDLVYALYGTGDTAVPQGMRLAGGATKAALGTAAPALNTWTHLAVTYDGSNLRMYVNGTLTGTTAATGNMANSALPLRIGGNAIWGEYFAGRIDEVRVFNRALSATELTAMMNAPVAGASSAQPTQSSSITVDPVGRRVWVVNPDTDTVTALNADTYAVQTEVAVGKRPVSVALDASNQLWVACRDDDTLWVLNATTGASVKVLSLPWGSAPVGVVLTPDRATGYVALQGSGQIQKFTSPNSTLGAAIALGSTPRALAVTADGKKLLVTQFVSSGSAGTVRTVDLATFAASGSLQLPLESSTPDGSLGGRGLPNYLAGVAADPASGLAWVVGKKDNILRGVFRDGNALSFETTVRAIVSRLDLNQGQEQLNRRLDLDNMSAPSAVTLSDTGALAFVTLQGNNRLIVLNQVGQELARNDTGLAPGGVVIDPVTKRVFTQDLMSRTVSVFDGAPVISQSLNQLPRLAQVNTVTTEKLSAAVLKGKQIFYNAADSRMSRDAYISCASCHVDGDQDGQVWDFTDRGEGLRNTITLRGQGGQATAPLHWSGNFDEVQDFENDMRQFFGGTGFMADADFNAGTRNQPLGTPKAGISADLDALAAYVNSLTSAGRSPRRQSNGTMTANATAGQALFVSAGCQSCHSGSLMTDRQRHDVGTLKPSSGNRLGGVLDGIDTPTLRGLWATAPYLHDGSAPTLRDVLTTANPTGQHGNVSTLTPTQIDQLVEYLNQIE